MPREKRIPNTAIRLAVEQYIRNTDPFQDRHQRSNGYAGLARKLGWFTPSQTHDARRLKRVLGITGILPNLS